MRELPQHRGWGSAGTPPCRGGWRWRGAGPPVGRRTGPNGTESHVHATLSSEYARIRRRYAQLTRADAAHSGPNFYHNASYQALPARSRAQVYVLERVSARFRAVRIRTIPGSEGPESRPESRLGAPGAEDRSSRMVGPEDTTEGRHDATGAPRGASDARRSAAKDTAAPRSPPSRTLPPSRPAPDAVRPSRSRLPLAPVRSASGRTTPLRFRQRESHYGTRSARSIAA